MANLTSTARRALDIRDVEQKTSYKRTAIREMIAKGDFPKPFKVGRKRLWYEDEVDSWLDARSIARVSYAPCVRRVEGRC